MASNKNQLRTFPVLLCYAFALAGALPTYFSVLDSAFFSAKFPELLGPSAPSFFAVLAADAVATIIVFAFSYAYKNSSLYDPYWSVVPPLIALAWCPPTQPLRVMIFFLIGWWAIRLTYNWWLSFPNLAHEDWRYRKLKEDSGVWYWLVSFLGIHFFPTFLVFLGCVPLYWLGTQDIALSAIDLLPAFITASAITIEQLSDKQLRDFVATRKDSSMIMNRGLWKLSRHPNYFGEVFFWVGIASFALIHGAPTWVGVGVIAMVLLFVFISIPMIEKRQKQRKPAYADYCESTSMIIPWFPKKRASTGSLKNRDAASIEKS